MKIQEDKIRKDKIHLNIRVTLFVEKIKKKRKAKWRFKLILVEIVKK